MNKEALSAKVQPPGPTTAAVAHERTRLWIRCWSLTLPVSFVLPAWRFEQGGLRFELWALNFDRRA